MYDDGERLFNLINPSMYKQALSEFMKYGEFVKFPTRYIYQWMAIIMANTAKIHSITTIAGHSQWGAEEEFINHYFMGDSDLWDEYKQEHYSKTYNDYECMCEYLDNNGFYDWTKLPDGSDAWSDYGLQPLAEICQEYNENMSPEEVIVLINRALDVTHQRGDLASAFIVGGSKTLSEISNGNNITESKLRGIIRESIINILLEDIDINYERDNSRYFSHSTTWKQIDKEIDEQGYSIINANIGNNQIIQIKIDKNNRINSYHFNGDGYNDYETNLYSGLMGVGMYLHNKRAKLRREEKYGTEEVGTHKCPKCGQMSTSEKECDHCGHSLLKPENVGFCEKCHTFYRGDKCPDCE